MVLTANDFHDFQDLDAIDFQDLDETSLIGLSNWIILFKPLPSSTDHCFHFIDPEEQGCRFLNMRGWVVCKCCVCTVFDDMPKNAS
ncbi:hypothetical protein L2E82_48634 [Cichorium intybus]|uniref:Uncharacterized protein n=1 Tax=Cichorium intybus TaxID=13427 RepID=A0ACB8Z2R2_CICIN|nr:hypothetical protein L2E82_48634 [Cichorium intybus]